MAPLLSPGAMVRFVSLAFPGAVLAGNGWCVPSIAVNTASSIPWTAPTQAAASDGRRSMAVAMLVGVLAIVLIGSAWRAADGGRPSVTSETSSAVTQASRPAAGGASSAEAAAKALENVPLSFIGNTGQADARAHLYAQGPGYSFAFTRGAAQFVLTRAEGPLSLDLRFLAARPDALPEGREKLPGTANFLYGNDSSKWHTGVPTYGQVAYPELWPGIDMVFAGGEGRLEYTFLVAPGASVDDIGLNYDGADALSIDAAGNLRIQTHGGVLTDTKPETYQLVGGSRIGVESHFVLRTSTTFGLAVGAYDPSLPLVVDPGLVYSTFLGGSSDDNGFGIAIDGAGNAYVTGFTSSNPFPPTAGAFDTSFNGGQDVFVTKLNPAGTTVLYSTYIGGSSNEQGLAITVDGSGNAYLTGFTGSSNFPTKFDPAQVPPGTFVYDASYNGGSMDAFVTKVNPTGTGLVFSTFAGGSGADEGWGIAVHSSGDVYVTGDTTSTNIGVTPSPFRLQPSLSGPMDAFFLRLDRFAAAAAYMTYLGGSGSDSARAIAIDASRNVYLTGGTTSSTGFPTVAGSFDTSFNGVEDAFATKLTYGGSTTVGGVSYDTYNYGYSTYLGGTLTDRGLGITIDPGRSAYVTGITASTGTASTAYPTSPGAFDTSFNGGAFDAFVTKLGPMGGALPYSTYLGGSGDDRGQGIALDSANDAHVAGRTGSSNFPTTPGAFDESYNGGDDAFVTKFNPAGSSPLLYSTYLGGSSGPSGNNDRGMAIAVDASANAYVTGLTASSNFPTTPGAYDTSYNAGPTDAFVTKLDMIGAPYAMTLTPPAATNTVGNPHTVTATVRDFAGRPVPGVTVRFSVTGVNTVAPGSCVTNANGQCTFTYTGTVAGTDTIAAYADTNNNNTQNAGEPAAVATKNWLPGPAATLTLTPTTATNMVGTTHCVTATVRDAFGNPVPSVTVRFSVPTAIATAAAPSSGSATTNANGQAQFCYSAALPGTDAIHAYADSDGDASQDPGEPFGDATKVWTPPASTSFCEVSITNGGWIIATNGDRATFGGNAKVNSTGSIVQGQEEYQDHGPAMPRNVKSIQLLATTCDTTSNPKTATIYGRATVNGGGDFVFRIDVTDGGNGGSTDSYGILMSDGYASGQHLLGGGNVYIHKS
jgi:hypothetical protein